MTGIVKCCRACGGANIVCDASAAWDPAAQTWALDQVFDEAWCDDCERDVALVGRPSLESPAAASAS